MIYFLRSRICPAKSGLLSSLMTGMENTMLVYCLLPIRNPPTPVSPGKTCNAYLGLLTVRKEMELVDPNATMPGPPPPADAPQPWSTDDSTDTTVFGRHPQLGCLMFFSAGRETAMIACGWRSACSPPGGIGGAEVRNKSKKKKKK